MVTYGRRYGSVARFAPYTIPSRYRMAYRGARMAYKMASSRGAKRAYRTIGRSFKNYRAKKRARRSIGRSVKQAAPSKIFASSNVTVAAGLNTKVLNFSELTDIPQKGGTDNLQRTVRTRQTAFVKGFKVCLNAVNTTNVPLHWNVAVLAKRTNDQQVIDNTDFFRSYNSENRAESFSSANLTGLDYACRPINSDRFIVLKHKRMLVAPVSSSSFYNGGNSSNYRHLEFYTKLGRTLTWEARQDVDADQKVWLVMWCSVFASDAGATSVPGLTYYRRTITYFKDVGNA